MKNAYQVMQLKLNRHYMYSYVSIIIYYLIIQPVGNLILFAKTNINYQVTQILVQTLKLLLSLWTKSPQIESKIKKRKISRSHKECYNLLSPGRRLTSPSLTKSFEIETTAKYRIYVPPKIDEKSSRIENVGQLHFLIALVLQKEVIALSF